MRSPAQSLQSICKRVPLISALVVFALGWFLVGGSRAGHAQTADSDQVLYPNAEVEFICGPQLKAGSALNPAPWFDAVAQSMGITQGERNPRIAPFGPMWLNSTSGVWENVISGRVSINSGGLTVTGTGTTFRQDIDPAGSSPSYDGHLRIRDEGGVERAVKVRSVESDTSLTLVSPWEFGSVSNAVADTYNQDPNYGANTDRYYGDNYYDTVLVEYINYYRTGNPRFLEYARKLADARWHSQWIADGTVTGGSNHLPVRSAAFAGLMLRALDGRPELWDYLEREVRSNFELWVYQRKHNPSLFYDLREDGYAQLYAVLLAKVLPDSYPLYGNGTLRPATGMAHDGAAKRRTYLAQTEDTAVNFFGRLQRTDGSWRWDADNSADPNEQFRDVEQPFMVGLYLESVILLHQLSSNPAVRANLSQQLTRSVTHLFQDAYQRNATVTDFPQYKWRGMFYFWGGGTVANPTFYSPPPPSTTANGDLNSWVRGQRHLNSTIHHAFGYAFLITGDPVYKQMGDEVFDASYGDTVDGIHCLADSGKGKDYAMNFRASGRYLVWRLASATPSPSPSSTPTPNVSPTPTPTPSVSPTPTPTVSPTPTPTPSPTPTPTPDPGAHVRRAKKKGQNLSNELATPVGSTGQNGTSLATNETVPSDFAEFVAEIQQAHNDLSNDRDSYPAAARIELALQAAYDAGGRALLAAADEDAPSVKSSLRIAITNLELSDALITYGDIANPIDATSYMVRQHYVDFLDREPDEAGGGFWISEIDNCALDWDCIQAKRLSVSSAFFLSIEFQQTGYYVYRLYKASYGRMPLLREFLPDNASLAAGVIVGKAGWEARLAQNRDAFTQDWVLQPGFQARYQGLPNDQFVDVLISNLGVTVSAMDREALIGDLSNGMSRARVLSQLVENPAVSRGLFNSGFVLMEYLGYLGRDPDSEGFNFWLNKLNEFDGDYRRAEMVKAFLNSAEYRQRFGQ